MCSNRVIGAESCNSENIQGYYMGDGATFLYQTGEEYRNIFPFWDWKKIPGTTTQQNNDTLPVLTAAGYRIESDFVGGMIGFPIGGYQNGVAAMVYNRNGLQARKAWFMFDDMIVCLGNSISAKTGLPVTTSINQVFLNKQSPFETSFGEIQENNKIWGKSSWILHDSVGYFFPDGGKIKVETNTVEGSWNWVASRYPNKIEQADIFKLYLDHGTNPKNSSYEYVIIPNATLSKMKEVGAKLPLSISNAKNKMEVISGDGRSIAIVFYEAGKSDVLGGIEVDKPCILVITEVANATLVRVADPTQKLSEIRIKLNDKWQIKHTKTEGNGSTALIQFFPNQLIPIKDVNKSIQFSISKK
jgi:chondroitin AC lyase